MRYVEFMEIKGGREIANFALDRSTKIFLKSIPAIHVFNAWFKEQTGDVFGAHAAFVQYETESDSSFIENVIKEANMKKRLGNFAAASNIFKEALAIAVEKQKFHILPNLYIHFSRLEYMITGSVDAARDILIDGIRCVPESKMLLEELIKFAMMHGGPRHINAVDAVVANAISPGTDVSQGLSAKDGEYISRLYLEFVDLCGTIYDVKKAWNRHIKLFPHCLRTMSIYKYPATSSKPLRIAMEGRPDIIAAMPCHPFGDSGSDRLALIPIEEQGLSCPENHDIHSEQVVNVQLEPEAANKSAQEGLQLVIPKVPGQHREEASEPNVSDSVVKEYNEIESVQALLALSRANDLQQEVEHEPLQDPKSLSLECLSLNPQGKESPESIPASSHEVEAPEEACRSNGIITESVYNTDENPPSSSPVGTSADDPAEIHSESVGPLSSASPQLPTPTEELSQSLVPKSGGGKWNQTDGTDKYAQIQMSPERHKNPLPSEAVPHPQLSVNGAGNRRQMNNADKVHRDSSPRFHGHSRNKRRASRHVPLEQQYPRDQIGTQMLVSQGNPGQPFSWQNQQNQQGSQAQHPIQTAGQGNLTATHAWPMQIVQQQNFASTSSCQVPAQPVTQAQVSQYPMQINEQYGHMQNSQAYNQMWHYYYYQQQQHFIQQQQLQLQQQPQQQQHPQESEQLQQQQLQPSQQPLSQQQQSHQQQLLHQQYQQQHLELQQHYLQQHQQQFQHQQNHQQQLQLQQQQYVLHQQQSYQQQQQQQQHLLYLQQLQQQQQEHEPQKQQQQQQLQQKEDQEQQQQQLLITPLQIQQAWNNYQQASLQYYDATSHSGTESNQQIMVPQGQPATPHSTSSSEHAASPGVQQQSPKLMKQTDDNSPINSV